MELEFGNPAHIALRARGQIPKEAENGKTRILPRNGCVESCGHCQKSTYRCENCGGIEYKRSDFELKFQGEIRCKWCKFLIISNE